MIKRHIENPAIIKYEIAMCYKCDFVRRFTVIIDILLTQKPSDLVRIILVGYSKIPLLMQLLVDGSYSIFKYLINVLDSKYLLEECSDVMYAGKLIK